MLRLHVLFACCYSAIAATAASAALGATLATEDFDYTVGSPLNGQNGGTGWTSAWTAHANVSISGTQLTPTNGPTGSLQSALIANIGGDVANTLSRSFTPFSGIPGNPMYVGMTIRATNLESGDFANFLLSDGATGNTNEGVSFGLRNTAGNPFFARAGSSNSPGQTTNSSTNANNAGDFRIVAKFTPDALGRFGTAEIFIDPVDFVEPLMSDALATNSAPTITQLSLFSVRTLSIDGDDNVFIDNLIIADTFAEASGLLPPPPPPPIPEPASIAIWSLLGLVCAVLLWRNKRRRAMAL